TCTMFATNWGIDACDLACGGHHCVTPACPIGAEAYLQGIVVKREFSADGDKLSPLLVSGKGLCFVGPDEKHRWRHSRRPVVVNAGPRRAASVVEIRRWRLSDREAHSCGRADLLRCVQWNFLRGGEDLSEGSLEIRHHPRRQPAQFPRKPSGRPGYYLCRLRLWPVFSKQKRGRPSLRL